MARESITSESIKESLWDAINPYHGTKSAISAPGNHTSSSDASRRSRPSWDPDRLIRGRAVMATSDDHQFVTLAKGCKFLDTSNRQARGLMRDLYDTSSEPIRKPFSVRSLVSALGNNVKFGMFLGLCLAIAFAALSTITGVLGVWSGRKSFNPFATLHMTYRVGLACHLVAGIVGGAIAGAMRPLGRWVVGAMLIGSVAGCITAVVFSIGEYGRHFWNSDTRVIIVGFSCLGAIMAPYLRSKIRSGSRIGASLSK